MVLQPREYVATHILSPCGFNTLDPCSHSIPNAFLFESPIAIALSMTVDSARHWKTLESTRFILLIDCTNVPSPIVTALVVSDSESQWKALESARFKLVNWLCPCIIMLISYGGLSALTHTLCISIALTYNYHTNWNVNTQVLQIYSHVHSSNHSRMVSACQLGYLLHVLEELCMEHIT